MLAQKDGLFPNRKLKTMHPELEKLMEFALADGQISEKELKVLHNKADALGEDRDELEMILEAKLHLAREDSMSAQAPPLPVDTTPKPTTNKEGSVKKCPACGAAVKSFTANCAECGHEYRDTQANSTAKELLRQLQNAEQDVREGKRQGHSSENMADKVNNFFNALDLGGAQMLTEVNRRKAEIITLFPVPNTKEDLLELLALAAPEAGKKVGFAERLNAPGSAAIKSAWRSKCEQVLIKARLTLQAETKELAAFEIYAHQLKL